MKLLSRFKKVKASSLMESVMATAIIAICLVMATIVFVNVFKTAYDTDFIRGANEIQNILQKISYEKEIDDHTYTYENYNIIQRVLPYTDDAQLQHIQLELKTSAKSVTFHYLIPLKDEDEN